jgi:NADH dehydrogenase
MAVVGEWKGVWDYDPAMMGTPDLPESLQQFKLAPALKGIIAFILWRSAYFTKQVSWTNKMLIPMYWFKTMLFGRDISRF